MLNGKTQVSLKIEIRVRSCIPLQVFSCSQRTSLRLGIWDGSFICVEGGATRCCLPASSGRSCNGPEVMARFAAGGRWDIDRRRWRSCLQVPAVENPASCLSQKDHWTTITQRQLLSGPPWYWTAQLKGLQTSRGTLSRLSWLLNDQLYPIKLN